MNVGKAAPTMEALEALFEKTGTSCQACGRKMTISGPLKGNDRMTLQHDLSGEIKFFCKRCNSTHGNFKTDAEFYNELKRSTDLVTT